MEKKTYSGNGKPFVYVMYAHEDRESSDIVLSALREKGYELWPSERFDRRRIRKAAVVLFFLSPAAAANEAVNRAIHDAVQRNSTMLVIHLSPTELTATQRLLLNTQQAILRYDCASEEEFSQKLFGAAVLQNLQVTQAQKNAASRTTWTISAGIVLAVAASAFFALNSGGSVAPDSVLADLGYSGRMAEISEIWVYGNSSRDQCSEKAFPYTAFTKENDQVSGLKIDNGLSDCKLGDIISISDFSQLKNLKKLALAGNQVVDITPIFSLKKLTYLDLTANPVSDLSGIGEMSALETLFIDYTKVTDLTPLNNCENLKTVYVDEAQYSAASDNLGNASFDITIVGPSEEINNLFCHFFTGPENSDWANAGKYAVYIQTSSSIVYKSYEYQVHMNGNPLEIEKIQYEDINGDGAGEKTHLMIKSASMSTYDPSATYTLVVTSGSSRATYQIWHKFDKGSEFANLGNLIDKAN